jgi:hypothetical protein
LALQGGAAAGGIARRAADGLHTMQKQLDTVINGKRAR